MTTAYVCRRHARLLLLQDRNDLLFAEPAPLHLRPTPSCRTLLKIGHISGEHVNHLDEQALERAMRERRGDLSVALIHPTPPKELVRVPSQSIEDMLDVWLGRETLRLRREKANAPNIARWIVATGRSNRSPNHAALATRVDKDLKRIAMFERIVWDGGMLLAPLDIDRELPSTLP